VTGKRENGLIGYGKTIEPEQPTLKFQTLVEEGWLPLTLVQKLLKRQIKGNGIASVFANDGATMAVE